MKNHRFVPSSAGEGDYLPTGEFAISVPGRGLFTHMGDVPLPPGEAGAVRYPAITTVGGFRIAAQCQSSVRPVVIWEHGQWRDGAAFPVGTQPVIYDNVGTLLVNNGGAGAQGYQYVGPDNIVHTGDACQGPLHGVNNWIDVSIARDRSLLIGFANWAFAVIVWDGSAHRLIEAGDAKTLRAHRLGDAISLTWRKADGAPLILTDEAELRSLPIFEPSSTASEPIGPRSASLPADGTLHDLAPFLHCDPSLSPRGGPGQEEHVQIEEPDGQGGTRIIYGKFGNDAHELFDVDADWIKSLSDASGPNEVQVWTDSRWLPRRMAIGEQHAFITGGHYAIWKDRRTCQELRRLYFNRKMWVHAIWPEYDCGPDLGIRPVALTVYDPTDRAYSEQRIIERHLDAVGAGWLGWEEHRSDRVYPRGPNGGAEFTEGPNGSLIRRVNFYRLGGSNTRPRLTGCVQPPYPTYPPWEPAVIPIITVTHYDPTLVKGRPWELTMIVGDTNIAIRLDTTGNLTAHAKNPAGEDQTARPRHVEISA